MWCDCDCESGEVVDFVLASAACGLSKVGGRDFHVSVGAAEDATDCQVVIDVVGVDLPDGSVGAELINLVCQRHEVLEKHLNNMIQRNR